MKAQDYLILGAVGAGIFLALKLLRPAQAALDALGNAGAAIGSGLFDLFHPNQVGETLFYTTYFPNGSRHAVASQSVSASGQFQMVIPPLANTRWQLLQGKDGRKYATPV